VVSDGSFQDQQGAAAWTIEGYDKNNQIIGKGSTPGLQLDQSAYCSELFSLWGIFKALQQFCQEARIQSGHVQRPIHLTSSTIKETSQPSSTPLQSHWHNQTTTTDITNQVYL